MEKALPERYGQDIPIRMEVLTAKNKKYTESFLCNNPSIDHYFHKMAHLDEASVTYLFIDKEKDLLISCLTLSCSAIFTASEEAVQSTLFSAIEIQFFAVDERYQHLPYQKGAKLSLSHYLFEFVIDYIGEISHKYVGAAKIVLYSVPEAIKFYQRCKFKEFGEHMYGDKGTFLDGCTPMYFDLNRTI